VQISRIRLFGRRIRYVAYRCTMRGGGSEKRFSSESIVVQLATECAMLRLEIVVAVQSAPFGDPA